MRIDIDTCEEILVTITRNKTRSLLTAFGVFWGIFMLVALIGGGQGMQEQMKSQFEGFATNSGFIAAQKTSEAYKGFRKGRWWDLEMEDVERVRSIDGIKIATPSFALWGQTAVYGENKYECSVKGLYPEYEQIEHQEMTYGRFINDVDIREARKVCVIGKRVYESLFRPDEDPCGKYIRVNGIYYRVIGMCSSEGNVNIQGQASEAVTLPFTTMQQTYNLGAKDRCCVLHHETGSKGYGRRARNRTSRQSRPLHFTGRQTGSHVPQRRSDVFHDGHPDDRHSHPYLDGGFRNFICRSDWRIQHYDGYGQGTHHGDRHTTGYRCTSQRYSATNSFGEYGADHSGRHGGNLFCRIYTAYTGKRNE